MKCVAAVAAVAAAAGCCHNPPVINVPPEKEIIYVDRFIQVCPQTPEPALQEIPPYPQYPGVGASDEAIKSWYAEVVDVTKRRDAAHSYNESLLRSIVDYYNNLHLEPED